MDGNEFIMHYFLKFGDRKCYFKLNNGVQCQGWIDEVDNGMIKFIDSGPLKSDSPIFLKITDIDVETLCYWDDNSNKWLDFSILLDK